ncbi:MAG: hypothetical protein ACYSXF_09135 [Planctomycetota bacterium]|jgi:hypothetical protein
MRTSLFGVDFIWQNPGDDCEEAVESGMREIGQAVLTQTAAAIRRQKRDIVTYWDAMTCLAADDGFVPARLHDRPEYRLAVDLVAAMGTGRLEARHSAAIADLGELESIRLARSRPTYEFGETVEQRAAAVPRPCTDRVDFGVDGQWKLRRAGPCRLLEVDMGDLKGRADQIDWWWAHLLAVLIQLRADIEIYLETGFLRIHRCERAACASFFSVARMAGRQQRFCSNSCRAAAAREQPESRGNRAARDRRAAEVGT